MTLYTDLQKKNRPFFCSVLKVQNIFDLQPPIGHYLKKLFQLIFLMKYLLLIICGLLTITACTSERQSPKDFSSSPYQALSALGDTLDVPPLAPETKQKYEEKLDSARNNYEKKPGSADALIRYGRNTAYLGNYQKAIAIYSQGIEQHPQNARLYRHRGHRYITTRQFDKAVNDLKKATELIYGQKDTVETDGAANDRDEPRSTLHTNIWYHLGLAHYLKGDFDKAKNAYEECLRASTNDDMLVATSYWLYMTLRRNGMDDLAGDVLEPIAEKMNVKENDRYHQLLLVFKGVFNPGMLQKNPSDNDQAIDPTIGYGLGNWHYINGRQDRAKEFFRKVYKGKQWNTFGYIAAETDLARLFGS